MKRVLIVDDSISVGRHLEKIITSTGEFEVLGQAKNGAEALVMYRGKNPDIVCMDINMPIMNGIEALRNLMAFDREANVVIVTSLGGVEDNFNDAIRFGARNVICKPFEPDDVLRTLRDI